MRTVTQQTGFEYRHACETCKHDNTDITDPGSHCRGCLEFRHYEPLPGLRVECGNCTYFQRDRASDACLTCDLESHQAPVLQDEQVASEEAERAIREEIQKQIRESQVRYLTTAESASLIRTRLKAEFPGAKFSVRSQVYAGGSSVNVDWTDGPTEKQVNTVIAPYDSKDFDGMIDLEYTIYSWLLPDGTATRAYTGGATGSAGTCYPFAYPKPDPAAELVCMGAGYLHGNRHYSMEAYGRALEVVAKRCGLPKPDLRLSKYGGYELDSAHDGEWFKATGDYPGTHVWKELKDQDLTGAAQ